MLKIKFGTNSLVGTNQVANKTLFPNHLQSQSRKYRCDVGSSAYKNHWDI